MDLNNTSLWIMKRKRTFSIFFLQACISYQYSMHHFAKTWGFLLWRVSLTMVKIFYSWLFSQSYLISSEHFIPKIPYYLFFAQPVKILEYSKSEVNRESWKKGIQRWLNYNLLKLGTQGGINFVDHSCQALVICERQIFTIAVAPR